jgi:predicted ATPase
LAAARVKLMSPKALLDRLDRRLPTLTGGARDLPPRQRTLRDTIVWSHDLLSPDEQRLFRRLSVFVAGWTLAGAEAINAIETSEPRDPLQILAGLVDQNLVDERPYAGAEDEPRYGMLETIREFASERLAASSEAEQVERAFEEFLMARAEAAAQGLQGPRQLLWLERLEAEHGNLRASLARALERGDGDVVLGLAPRLWQFWSARGYPGEGHAWLKRALTLTAAPERRAAAEFALGKLAIDLGDYEAAEENFRACLALRRELGDLAAEAEALNELAVVAVNTRRLPEARELGEEALKLAQSIDDRRGIGAALRNLGMVAREQGDYPRAIELYGQSLEIWRRLGDLRWIAFVLSSLGITHRYEGNAPEARVMLDESQTLFAQQGDRYMLGVIAHNKGHLAYAAQEYEQATALYAEALGHFDAVGAPEGVVESIEWLAVALVAKGQAISALKLFGSAAAAREVLNLPPQTVADSKLMATGQERALQTAGAEGLSALTAGSARSLVQARDDALAFVSEPKRIAPIVSSA